MILNNLLRMMASLLSSWYPNDQISRSNDLKIRKFILKKIKNTKLNNSNLKKTHIEFNRKILNLLKSKNIKNFLRINFIQKMFFLQNRLFVLKELNQIRKSKKWLFYKNLLKEDNIGNPIRYFLYFESSGNKINHLYHLYLLERELNINLKKNIKTVFEFGAGYGCMARIFSKIKKRNKYICFDTSYLNLLQYYYLKHNNLNVGFKKKNDIFLTSSLKNVRNKNDLFVANWSLSETPIKFRKRFISIISKSRYILISFQEKFENVNNLNYFKFLRSRLSKKFEIKIIKNKFYNGNIFTKQNHYFLIGKKL